MAELYCEILETLSLEDKARAVIFDDSSAARERAREILSPEHLILHSQSNTEDLDASLTESEIWSAVQVAQLLGLEENIIKEVLAELCSEEQVNA